MGNVLGAIQKILVKLGGTDGSGNLAQNVTVGKGWVQQFNTCQF